MSIGEAEVVDIFGKQNGKTSFLGNDSSYLKKILDTGFDGDYLDMIDAFEQFEH